MPLIDHNKEGFGLLIGDDPATRKPLYYSDERGLVTIAAPGSGKTQCFMLPNLMTWRGPAIVLDVTGQLWATTSKQRSKLGPVYRLDLDDPDQSDCYNPLSSIRRDPQLAWGDAQTFAALVFSRQSSAGSDGGFYDKASLQYIATLACFVAMREPDWRRNPERLVAYVSGGDFDGFLKVAAEQSNLPALQNAAQALKASDERTRGNVIWTARNCLSAWEDPQTARISRMSDWQPDMIRDHNATLYITLSLEKLVTHPGLVRLVVGQHLRAFMRKAIDRQKTPIVQFFLDETPQLRNMDVLPQAIEAGRNFNIRVWMVMQWKGQLIEAYGKELAEGMIGACGLQTYLNPGLSDGLAGSISDQIGSHDNRLDGTKRPIVTPQALAGPEYGDDVIAFDHGVHKRLRKHFYHADRGLKAMAGQSP